jgi:hypothetical protein
MLRWVGILALCWACTGWAAAQAPDDIEYLAETDWQIPITLVDPIRKEATLLTLYVSTDLGKTWKKEANAKPSDEFFKYLAPGDGTYWFSVSFVNRAGETVPARESELQPQLKIVVDTKRPQVKLQAVERQGTQVTVAWEARDDHLDLNTLQVQYKPQGASAWRAIALTPGTSTGRKQFDVGSPGSVSIRLNVKDRAGNVGEDQIEMLGSQVVTALQQPPPAAPPSTGGTGAATGGPPMLPLPAPATAPVPGQTTGAAPLSAQPLRPGAEPGLPAPPLGGTPPALNPPSPGAGSMPQPASDGFKPATQSAPWNNPMGTSTGHAPRRTQPGPILWSNSLHLDLDFDLKAGPSGIGALELYYTVDAGKTWQLMEKREETRPPFGIDVPGEGIYGFTLVARNKVGLGRPAPSPGEAPELRIGVDVTAPVCELIGPVEAVPGRRDMVNIKWSAMDHNLASTPVRIEWSETANGPWQTVVERSANTGSFLWRVPANIPPQVYFKLEVTDMAGNVGNYVTREPVIVDLQEPEVRLKSLLMPKK